MAIVLKTILLAEPRGFCAGVIRAIRTVEEALTLFGAPVYVRHEIVHNQHVVARLRQAGAIFVKELSEVPDGATVVFSAHGVSPAIRTEAQGRGLRIIDATCPLVTKVHQEAQRFGREQIPMVLVGHRGHPEVAGTMGEAPMTLIESVEDVAALPFQEDQLLAVLTQTTLSVDETRVVIEALKKRYSKLVAPPQQDICYATTNRQAAVKALALRVDHVLVIGDPRSSNSVRLVETARAYGAVADLVPNPAAVDLAALIAEATTVGVTAGASAPEEIVEDLVSRLRTLAPAATVESLRAVEEKMFFGLPREITEAQRAAATV